MQKSVGMAIRIAPWNVEKLSIVNGGVVPEYDEEILSFFYFPYNFDAHVEILHADVFYKRFEFANVPNDAYFVDVNEV